MELYFAILILLGAVYFFSCCLARVSYVCRGTIEERIDDLIESKKSLAKEIVEGGGETLVTEMSDEQLLQMVALDINKAQEN